MLFKYYKKSKKFDIDGGYNYDNLYSSFRLPKEYRDRNILSNLNIEYNVVELGDTIIFDSSQFYNFFKYEDDNIILISDNVNSILMEIKSFEVDYLSVSIVMTFGQVPLNRTMFTDIKSFRGDVYFEIDIQKNTYEFKKKSIQPNFSLWDEDYFFEYYSQKLENIGDYTLFYSSKGTDSNFLKYVKPDIKIHTFSYEHKEKNYYHLFKTLDGIDIHSLNFPNEYLAWRNVDKKIVTGFGGDGTFAIKNYGDYTIEEMVNSSGVRKEDCDIRDLEILENFIDGCQTLYDAREKCGHACSENTIPWSFKKSNSLVFNPLSDSVVRETFKYEPHDYDKRFLNKFVNFKKDVTPFNMDYWEDFYSESMDEIINKYVYEESNWNDNIYKQNNQMKFLVELYYNSKEQLL